MCSFLAHGVQVTSPAECRVLIMRHFSFGALVIVCGVKHAIETGFLDLGQRLSEDGFIGIVDVERDEIQFRDCLGIAEVPNDASGNKGWAILVRSMVMIIGMFEAERIDGAINRIPAPPFAL
jgi:hypothetical protein